MWFLGEVPLIQGLGKGPGLALCRGLADAPGLWLVSSLPWGNLSSLRPVGSEIKFGVLGREKTVALTWFCKPFDFLV